MKAHGTSFARMARVAIVVGTLVGALVAASPGGAAAGQRDRDSDHLRNRFERLATETNPTDRDSDDDGLVDAKDDEDCDGLTNRVEFRADSDPLDADSDEDGIEDGDDEDVDDGNDENDDDEGEDDDVDDPSCDVDDGEDEDEDDGEEDDD